MTEPSNKELAEKLRQIRGRLYRARLDLEIEADRRRAAEARAEKAEAKVAAAVNYLEREEYWSSDEVLAILAGTEAPPIPSSAEALITMLRRIVEEHSSPTVGRGEVHGGERGNIVYENSGWPFIEECWLEALASLRTDQTGKGE